MAVSDRVKDILVHQLNVDPEDIKPETTLDDLGMDELDIAQAMHTFEEEFGVEIPDEEAEMIGSVREIIEFVQHKAV